MALLMVDSEHCATNLSLIILAADACSSGVPVFDLMIALPWWESTSTPNWTSEQNEARCLTFGLCRILTPPIRFFLGLLVTWRVDVTHLRVNSNPWESHRAYLHGAFGAAHRVLTASSHSRLLASVAPRLAFDDLRVCFLSAC